jgi:hypothetical protein
MSGKWWFDLIMTCYSHLQPLFHQNITVNRVMRDQNPTNVYIFCWPGFSVTT